MKAPSPPPPPDPYKVSAADQQGHTGTAIAQTWMQNANERGPTGNVDYNQTGTRQVRDAQGNMIDVPTFTRTVTLSPQEQAMYELEGRLNQQMGGMAESQLGRLNAALSEPMNLDGLPEQRQISGNYEDYRNRGEQALRSRMQPQLDRMTEMDRTRLANQGIRLGSDNYSRAEDQIGRNRNDAELAIIAAGGGEADRALQHDISIADATGTLRERALQERMLSRNQPLNEIAALMSGTQVNMPQFSPFQAGRIMPTSVGDNIWKEHEAKMRIWEAKRRSQEGMMGGLFGMAAKLPMLLMSDRRLKADVRQIGTHSKGWGVYSYRYLWDEPGTVRTGYMADEVAKVAPEAVAYTDNGYAMVNYGVAG